MGNGVDLVIHELATRLVEHYGHTVDVWTPTSDGTYDGEPYNLRKLYVYGDKWNRFLPILELNALTAMRKLRQQLAGEGAAYDLVVPCTHPYYGAGDCLGLPSVFFNFGNVPTTGFTWKSKLNFQWLDISEDWFHKHRAAKVISISHFLHNQQSADVRHKGEILHLGGDHYGGRDEGRRSAFRERLGVEPQHVLLGYCGRLFQNHPEYKGTHKVLELGQKLQAQNERVRLVLCGAGYENDAQWIQGYGAIPLLYLPTEDMPGFFDALDVYVCASRWEGFNLPILEAAWHGAPSVAYDAGAHGEHVTSVLVRDGDFDGLCHEVGELAVNPSKLKELSDQAWKKAQPFSWDKVAQRFEAMLCGVLP